MLVHWLRKLWGGQDAPAAPILLRVVEPTGESARSMVVELSWGPSGRRIRRQVIASDGLCMLPWLGEEKQVSIVVRSANGRSETTVERAGNDGRVIDLSLVRELPLSTPTPEVVQSSAAAGRRGR